MIDVSEMRASRSTLIGMVIALVLLFPKVSSRQTSSNPHQSSDKASSYPQT